MKEIREEIPHVKWLHCPDKVNPADIPSRGVDITSGNNREVWLHGPEMLSSKNLKLHVDDGSFKNSDDEYVKTSTMVVKSNSENIPVSGIGEVVQIARFSYLERLLLCTSYVLRFVYNCLNKDVPRTGAEIEESKRRWIMSRPTRKHGRNTLISR